MENKQFVTMGPHGTVEGVISVLRLLQAAGRTVTPEDLTEAFDRMNVPMNKENLKTINENVKLGGN